MRADWQQGFWMLQRIEVVSFAPEQRHVECHGRRELLWFVPWGLCTWLVLPWPCTWSAGQMKACIFHVPEAEVTTLCTPWLTNSIQASCDSDCIKAAHTDHIRRQQGSTPQDCVCGSSLQRICKSLLQHRILRLIQWMTLDVRKETVYVITIGWDKVADLRQGHTQATRFVQHDDFVVSIHDYRYTRTAGSLLFAARIHYQHFLTLQEGNHWRSVGRLCCATLSGAFSALHSCMLRSNNGGLWR